MEDTIIKFHKAPIFVFAQIIIATIISDVILGVVMIISHLKNSQPFSTTNFTLTEDIFLYFLLFQLSMMVYTFITWRRDYFWKKGDILFHHRGIIFSRISEYDLRSCESIKLKQGVLGRLFDYGHVYISYPQEEARFTFCPSPRSFLKIITVQQKNKLSS